MDSPFRWRTKSGFCACVITFQMCSTYIVTWQLEKDYCVISVRQRPCLFLGSYVMYVQHLELSCDTFWSLKFADWEWSMVLFASPNVQRHHRAHRHRKPTLNATESSVYQVAAIINWIHPEDGNFIVHRKVWGSSDIRHWWPWIKLYCCLYHRIYHMVLI